MKTPRKIMVALGLCLLVIGLLFTRRLLGQLYEIDSTSQAQQSMLATNYMPYLCFPIGLVLIAFGVDPRSRKQ